MRVIFPLKLLPRLDILRKKGCSKHSTTEGAKNLMRSFSDLPVEQQKIVNALYNAWLGNPTGPGLAEAELAKQAGMSIDDLVREFQRLRKDGWVDCGLCTDVDRLGFIRLTDDGRDERES
jgi:hypothetical protein